MSFIDDVVAESRNTGIKCKTCVLIESLDTKTAEEVRTAMSDETFTTSALGRAMAKRGWEVSDSALRKHRQRCVVFG